MHEAMTEPIFEQIQAQMSGAQATLVASRNPVHSTTRPQMGRWYWEDGRVIQYI